MTAPLPAEFVKGVVRLDDLPRARIPEVAVSGRSNVGKSSLLNVLFARRGMARVSSTPGKTREINYFSVGGRYHLVDLPGYGYARAPAAAKRAWAELVQGYLETREELAGLLQLVDARHGATAPDREMLEWIAARGLPALVVATKVDKLGKSAAVAALNRVRAVSHGLPVQGFSAVTRDGRRPVLQWIDEVVKNRRMD